MGSFRIKLASRIFQRSLKEVLLDGINHGLKIDIDGLLNLSQYDENRTIGW